MIKELLTTFDGRIGRQQWWMGLLILIVISIVAQLVLGVLGGLGNILIGLVGIALLYPSAALATKRLHDHDQPQMPLLAVFLAPSALQILMGLTGLGTRQVTIGGLGDGIPATTVPAPTMLGWLFIVVSVLIGLWAIYYLGIKRGTEGPNSYGDDPVG